MGRVIWRWAGAAAVVLAVTGVIVGSWAAGWLPLPERPPYRVETLADLGANLRFLLGTAVLVGLLTGTAIAIQAWIERRRARRVPRH